MKIVFTSYTNTPEFNDPGLWLNRIDFYTGILEHLAKEYPVESIEQINYAGVLKHRGVAYHFLNFTPQKNYFPLRLHSYIKKLKPDMVFVNGFIFPVQIIQLRLKLGSSIKIGVINHAERPTRGFRKFLQQLADRCVNLYLFTSKETGEEWVRLGIISDTNKIKEVMEASSSFFVMDKDNAKEKTSVSGAPVFLWVGRLDINKDPLTVLKAFEVYIRQQPMAKLYMIFHTEELKDEITSFCNEYNSLQKAVLLIGKIPHKEMLYWYNSADFIISASHYEGSGLAVCEAMSCGCIPLLTNIPSFRKMTGHGKCGFLYEPGHVEGLSTALLKTGRLNTEEERNKVLRQFTDDLSFEAVAKKISTAIKSLDLI